MTKLIRGVSLLLFLTGCPDALEPPTALIRAGDARDSCGAAARTVEAQVGVPVALHAACSEDPNGLDLTYHWALLDQPSGSVLEIPNATVISPTVVPDVPGRYQLTLIVSNGTLTSKRALVTLQAEP